jgi:hypothetical protein
MKISHVILYFVLFTFLIALPPLALQYTGNTGLLITGFWTVFFFMSGLTFFALMLMLIVGQKKPDYFAQGFLGGTTLKILVSLVFIFVFVRNNTINKPVFLADFAYIYLLNMAFEIYILFRKLQHENLR